jgi:hypothetical protein
MQCRCILYRYLVLNDNAIQFTNLLPSFGVYFTANIFLRDSSMLQDTEKHRALTQVRCGPFPQNAAPGRKIEQTLFKRWPKQPSCYSTPCHHNWFCSMEFNSQLQGTIQSSITSYSFHTRSAEWHNKNLSTIYKDNSRTCSPKSPPNRWLQV